MICKHADSNYVAEFWRKFNDAYRKVNTTEQKFFLCGWVTDIAKANFSGLSIVYGEDVLTKVKGCDFHFKQSVERKVKTLNTKGEEFRNLALRLLIASTPEAYSHALRMSKQFSSNNAESIRDWTEWWDARKEFAFRAFTSFNAPQSNLAEVIHAGWKNRDKMGVSLLECCYFDLRDSILLTTNLNSLKNGGHGSGFGPSSAARRAMNTSRKVEHVTQLERDLLDFNVATTSSSPSEPTKRKMLSSGDVGCNPPKKTRKVKKMFDRRLNKAKALEQTMKVHRIVKVSNFKQEFDVLSTNTSRVVYKVIICNVPSCTCPDYKKNGMLVSCKHNFHFIICANWTRKWSVMLGILVTKM